MPARKNAHLINVRKVIRRDRQPGEIAVPMHAIRNHCLSCACWNSAEVARCPEAGCWLYPWRLYGNREDVPVADTPTTRPSQRGKGHGE
jgi:hypothetical protein